MFKVFEAVVKHSVNAEEAFEKVKNMKGVPAHVSEAFRNKYDPQTKLSPFDAFKKFYDELKGQTGRPADFNVQQLIEDLQGTCNSINDHLPEGMTDLDLTSEDYDAIDNEIFLCETCGWWCEISEQDEDGICQDCSEVDND